MNTFNLPAQMGLGLKPEHTEEILADQPAVGFFEIHAENYMVPGGAFHRHLSRIRAHYPLSLHGVGLSLGGINPLDGAHLNRLAQLIDRYQPAQFSEHLAWSAHNGVFYNDLLPLPLTGDTLNRVVAHIDQTQNHLKRTILIENPATYLEFSDSTMSEVDFLGEVIRQSGCGLLLDINNVYVSAENHHRSARAYINALPLERVGEIHLAGHSREMDGAGAPLLIDSHDRAVDEAVWNLYREVINILGPVPTLIEWDNNIPPFPALLAEGLIAEGILRSIKKPGQKMPMAETLAP